MNDKTDVKAALIDRHELLAASASYVAVATASNTIEKIVYLISDYWISIDKTMKRYSPSSSWLDVEIIRVNQTVAGHETDAGIFMEFKHRIRYDIAIVCGCVKVNPSVNKLKIKILKDFLMKYKKMKIWRKE